MKKGRIAVTKEDPVIVDDTFCEVFSAYFARVLITAATNRWAMESTLEAKGLGRSATLPPSEAFIEREARTTESPDGRPGYILQIADRKRSELEYWLVARIRKGVLPFPTTAVFDAFPKDRVEYSVKIENTPIQLFGDGYEEIADVFGRRVYRIPRMDGFFYVEEKVRYRKRCFRWQLLDNGRFSRFSVAGRRGGAGCDQGDPIRDRKNGGFREQSWRAYVYGSGCHNKRRVLPKHLG